MDVHGVFTLTGSERDAVERLPIQIHHLRADQDVVREGDRPTRCFALLDGFAASFKLTGEGKRQILAFISQVISRTSKAFTSRNWTAA
jgi:CRP-like cAMP-binding protein